MKSLPFSKRQVYQPKEHDIQTMIIQYLRLKGFYVWRHNSGMIAATNKYGKRRMIKMGVAGMPDVFALKGGRLYGIEVKRPKGIVTVLQEGQLAELTKHGAITMVAHSVEEVQEVITRYERSTV